jgi:hypothetical protein
MMIAVAVVVVALVAVAIFFLLRTRNRPPVQQTHGPVESSASTPELHEP